LDRVVVVIIFVHVCAGYSRTPSNYPGMPMGNYPQGGFSQQPGMIAGQRAPMHGNMMRPTPPGMVPPGVQPPGVMMRQGK